MSPKLLNILLILTPVILYFGYIDPFYNGTPGLIWTPDKSIFVLQADNQQQIASLDKVDTFASDVKRVYKSYTEIDPDTKLKVETMLPDQIDPIGLQNEVEAIASKKGIALGSIAVKSNAESRNNITLGAYSVIFDMKAHYSVFKDFMDVYEKNMRYYVLDSVRIKRPDKKKTGDSTKVDQEDDSLLLISVVSKVYYLK